MSGPLIEAWSPAMEVVLYHLASAALALEGLLAVVLITGTWLLRPDLIQSRVVVGGLLSLSAALTLDRGLAAAGYPLGALGLAMVATLGALSMAAAVRYHTTLSDIPRPGELAGALERAAAAEEEVTEIRRRLAVAPDLQRIREMLDADLLSLEALRRTVSDPLDGEQPIVALFLPAEEVDCVRVD